MNTSDLLQQAIIAARNGDKRAARSLFLDVVSSDPQNEIAWMWLSGLYESVDDQIRACEHVLGINPGNTRVREYLQKLRQAREASTPKPAANTMQVQSRLHKYSIEEAVQFEEEGKLDEALKVYRIVAGTTKDTIEFDRIYHQINKLEGMKAEKIRHVSPALSLGRLTVGWPLLYLLLVFVQSGLRVFAWSTLYLWTGLIWVSIGGFFLALVETRSRHPIWKKLLASRAAGGFGVTRFFVAASGWLLISISFLLLAFDSLHRLQVFEIPYPP